MFRVRALLILLTFAAPLIFAAGPRTEIRVEVKDQSGKPVERAAVVLDFLANHRQVFKLGRREKKHWEMRTNLQGVAHFPPIPQGTIRVQVIAKGLQTFGDDVDINEEQKTIEVEMKPPQKQYSVYGPGSDSSQRSGTPPSDKK